MTLPSFGQLAFYGLTLAFPLVIFYYCLTADSKTEIKLASAPQGDKDEKRSTTIMQSERTDLEPPKDDPFTQEQLRAYNGTDPSKPVYLAIKGTVFDVSRKRETYGPGGSYAVLAGKDGSRALGLSSLEPEDAVADWSTLEENERKVLDDWHSFFTKRYNIVGRVVDLPASVANK